MSSWFSIQPPSSAASENDNPLGPGIIHPVSSRYDPSGLFGELNDEDTAWLAQTSGFVTETQTFYLTLSDGRLAMCQVIHSSVGLWYPQIQFTFRYFDPNSKTHVWKSTNVTNFKTPPNLSTPQSASSSSSTQQAPASQKGYDKRSCQADQFSILLDPSQPDCYVVTGNHDDSVQLKFKVTRMKDVSGWKLGHDNRGGFTYFGNQSNQLKKDKSSNSKKPDITASSDGFLVHRFWPRCSVTGYMVVSGQMIELDNSRAIFIHAVQGMRPNLIASRWNFCNFQSLPVQSDEGQPQTDPGVSLTLMEFTTVPGTYGPAQVISVGSIVVGDRLVAVTCGADPEGKIQAKTTHEGPFIHDPDTGYKAPSSIRFQWDGPMVERKALSSGSGQAHAQISLDLGAEARKDGKNYYTQGLIGKVDVMAEIPYLVKKVVAAVAGAKPYIYTASFYPVFFFFKSVFFF
ncbi:oxidative stress survival, Svf1-like protein [Phakopsora pachyrhizi]|uniref:Oxidative stress survival, Svf1-like protein n=1 Tax=Phakopsora pachyrhizi TaxID=170000 RepID=A0AAV0AU07_PHAPC|nr:oxidative stress survival, Svf1-like protein [Phakopsora pachyrhizi]